MEHPGANDEANARRREVQAYYANNLAFHCAVVADSDNDTLACSYRPVVQKLHVSRLRILSRDIGMHVSMIEQDPIVAAIAGDDVERADGGLAWHVGVALCGHTKRGPSNPGGKHPT